MTHVIELTPAADGSPRRLPLKDGWAVFTGECVATLAPVAPALFDSIVTDPPYGLEFMGKEWDAPWRYGITPSGLTDGGDRLAAPSFTSARNPTCGNCGKRARTWAGGPVACACTAPAFPNERADDARGFEHFTREWASAVLRVAKPGAYLVAHGGPRTWHRLAVGVEDAGWTVHDSIGYGHDVETIARGLWDTLDVVQRERFAVVWESMAQCGGPLAWLFGTGFPKHRSKLKPAWEPIILAQKPGAPASATPLQIDACRLPTQGKDEPNWRRAGRADTRGMGYHGNGTRTEMPESINALGRWPANVILDESAANDLDAQAGDKGGGGPGGMVTFSQPNIRGNNYNRAPDRQAQPGMSYADSGGPSRFFYTAKASRSERNDGLDTDAGAELAERNGGSNARGFADDVARGHDRNRPTKNHHPTVKPLSLTRWLVRLITPPGGLVLDPMCGSGTTGVAAQAEGFGVVMIDREPQYTAIARARNRAARERYTQPSPEGEP